jgi:hypothetical protein
MKKVKRGELAPEELDKVIRLKKIGTSWLGIQRETGINRRTAKRAYEKWEHSQSPEVMREARRDVIAKAFLDHLKSLTTLAGSIVANLSVPASLADMEKNSEQFFAWLWEEDLLNRLASIEVETKEARLTVPQPYILDPHSYRREKQLLFKCLQDHTRGEGVRWQALEEWKKARDKCAEIIPKLREETSMVVNNYVHQERWNFGSRIKEEEETQPSRDSRDQMAEAVLSAIWQGILEDKQAENLVRIVSSRSASQGMVKVKDETFLIFNDTRLAEKVVYICQLAVTNLCKGEKADMVKSLQNGGAIMKKATEELREMLNPVRLTPMILRTRCDLCPA